MFFKIINRIRYKVLLSQIKPEIIGYRNIIGKFVSKTRVSNMTHISNKKNVSLGNNVFVGHFNYIDGYNKVVIEDGCQITNYVSIVTHSSHHTIRLNGYDNHSEDPSKIGLLSGDVHIGEFSYIGAHSVIMPGTRIGKGSIVSAYSYVNGQFPDYAILRGQPAKIIGSTKDIDVAFLEKYPEIRDCYFDKNDQDRQ